jgi:glyoxylase-like metal-dependent hydrolase (beta-lactamase superfamily II)
MIKRLILFSLMAIFGFSAIAGGRSAMEKQTELYAVKYGESLFPLSSIFEKGDQNKAVLFAWLFYVLKHNGRIILIDTGFSDPVKARDYGITMQNTGALLSLIGISPEKVTDIVVTHSHFDHVGNVDLFPNAAIYIQESEYGKLQPFMKVKHQIHTFSEELSLYDIITAEHIGGHTKGSSVVRINLNGRKILFTGDEAYLFDNINMLRPTGSLVNRKANLSFLSAAAQENSEIFTFHDPSIVSAGSFVRKI